MNMSDKDSKNQPGVSFTPGKSRFSLLSRKLARPVGKKDGSRRLWERDFSIVKEGLDEAEVVSFVNELLARQESHPALPEIRVEPGLAGEKVPAMTEFLKSRATLEDEIREKYRVAYSRLLSSLQNLVREGLDQENRLREEAARSARAFAEEIERLKKLAAPGNIIDTEQPKAEAPPAPEAPVEVYSKNRAEQKAPLPLEQSNRTLYSGEIELNIAPPVEPKMVARLFNYLQTVREVKILHTTGSWDSGPTLTLLLEKPLPLLGFIAGIEGLEVRLQNPESDEKKGARDAFLNRKRKSQAQRVMLVLAQKMG